MKKLELKIYPKSVTGFWLFQNLKVKHQTPNLVCGVTSKTKSTNGYPWRGELVFSKDPGQLELGFCVGFCVVFCNLSTQGYTANVKL